MVKIKICGITNLKDAVGISKLRPDALGFVFYKKSPRYITPDEAKEIIHHIPSVIKKVGVFVNAKGKDIKNIAQDLKLDMLQFHGDESPEFCKKFKNYRIIKVFRIKDKIDRKKLLSYKVFAYLLDSFAELGFGGTGRKFDWKLISGLDDIRCPVILSGGLTAGNVRKAIKQAKPQWVDVASSVESKPGKKDYRKVVKFIKAAKGRGEI